MKLKNTNLLKKSKDSFWENVTNNWRREHILALLPRTSVFLFPQFYSSLNPGAQLRTTVTCVAKLKEVKWASPLRSLASGTVPIFRWSLHPDSPSFQVVICPTEACLPPNAPCTIKLPLTRLATDGKEQASSRSVSEFRRHFLHVLTWFSQNSYRIAQCVGEEVKSRNWFSKPKVYAFSILAVPQK